MTGQEKFDTCQFRSIDKIEIGERSCCNDNRYWGYMCWQRNIENVTPAQCADCEQFLAKQELTEPE